MIRFIKKLINSLNRADNGVCSICSQVFRDSELQLEGELALCPKDLVYYSDKNWILVREANSNPEDPEAALSIYNLKAALMEISIPSYIAAKYSNFDGKIISTFELFISSDLNDDFLRYVSSKSLG